MIRRNTWIVLVVLFALIGLAFYLRDRQAKQVGQATPTPGNATLFNTGDGSPTDLRIQGSIGTVVEILRDQTGTWVLKEPAQVAADQASAEAAATQLGALRVLTTVQLGPDVVGLDKPSYTVSATFSTGKTHKLLVGSVTPIQDGYYSQLDGGPIVVVDKAGLDALLNMLTSPPYLATPTPLASPTPTAQPATATPSATEATPTGSGLTPAASLQAPSPTPSVIPTTSTP